MITEAMFSSKTDLWETPQSFFDDLDREFNFALDVCATPENAKCQNFFTLKEDGLKQKWGGTAQFGAIHHTEEKSANGCRKPMKQQEQVKQSLCFSRPGQTRNGFMITLRAKLRFDLSVGDLNSGMQSITHHSQA